jgi:hypothetical protein
MDTAFISQPVYFMYEPALDIVESSNDPGCGQASDGDISLSISPSQLVSVIDWSNGDSGQNISNIPSGNYTYTLLTNYGCVYTGDIVLQNTPVFTTQIMTLPYSDAGMGAAHFFMWGGVSPYLFELNGNTVPNPVEGLNPGSYDVYITDANGCTDTVNFSIENTSTANIIENDEFNVAITIENGSIMVSSPTMHEVQHIELFDMMGAKVLRNKGWESEGTSQIFLDSGALATGVYRLVLTFENFQVSRSISIY